MKEQSLEESVLTLLELGLAIPEDAAPELIDDIAAAAAHLSPLIKRVMGPPILRKVGLAFIKMCAGYLREILEAHERGKKIALCSFNTSPEILHAMDIVPMSPEVLTSAASIALEGGAEKYIDMSVEVGIPETMCTAQRGAVGAVCKGLATKPDFSLTCAPGSCDTNSKIFEFISEYLKIPYLTLDAPAYIDERGLKYCRKDYRRLISDLEKMTGRKLDQDRLRNVVEQSNIWGEYYAELLDLAGHVPNPVPNVATLLTHAIKYMTAGLEIGTTLIKEVLDASKERLKRGEGVRPEEKVRTLWIYTGFYFPNMEIWFWMEEHGMSYLLDMLTLFHAERRIDTSTLDSMIDGLADNLTNYPMTRQMRGPAFGVLGGWLEDLVWAAKKLKADCGIFAGHSACKNAWGAFKVVSDRLKEELGIPTLRLEADCWDERITPMSVIKEKIEEFVTTVVL